MQTRTNFIITIPYSPKKGVNAEQMWCPFLETEFIGSYDIKKDTFHSHGILEKIRKIKQTTKYNIYWLAVCVNDPELCYQTRTAHTGWISDRKKPNEGHFIQYRGKNLPELKAVVGRRWLQDPERSEDYVYFRTASSYDGSLTPGEASALKMWFTDSIMQASTDTELLQYLQTKTIERSIKYLKDGLAELKQHFDKAGGFIDALENAYNGPNFAEYLAKG